MTQHIRCRQCQHFFRPDPNCFGCNVGEWLLSLSRRQRIQLIWYLVRRPAPDSTEIPGPVPESMAQDGKVATAVAQPQAEGGENAHPRSNA